MALSRAASRAFASANHFTPVPDTDPKAQVSFHRHRCAVSQWEKTCIARLVVQKMMKRISSVARAGKRWCRCVEIANLKMPQHLDSVAVAASHSVLPLSKTLS